METLSEPRQGSWVRVRSRQEILASLGERGTLRGLPLMPEMLAYCGQVFRVRSRPGKTCVDARPMEMRTFPDRDIFLLDGVRCSGSAHGACERECLIFWRRQWLEPVNEFTKTNPPEEPSPSTHTLPTIREDGSYFCQSTALRHATTLLSSRDRLTVAWWDWRKGNLTIFQLAVRFIGPAWRKIRRHFSGLWPRGFLRKTPTDALGLQAGEVVRVKPMAEILQTLDTEGRNRGLVFEPDMTGFCGREFRVRRRVDRMISESTGKMIIMTNTVTLEEIACTCPFTFGGCPRTELQLWREIWLQKKLTKDHGKTGEVNR